MNLDKETFQTKFKTLLSNKYKTNTKNAAVYQIHNAISVIVMDMIAEKWSKSTDTKKQKKRACYLSLEFLVGRAVFNNLLCLGIYKEVEEALNDCDTSLSSLEEIEDAALGNGGLGRLAACFLDSAATLNLPLEGYGIRYRYGLFKQTLVDGFQHEEADNWTKHGDPWSVRCENDAVEVHFADQSVLAVPYDMPVIGYETDNVGTLRLWQAEAFEPFDFKTFNDQQYNKAVEAQNRAEDISRVLYPNDDTDEGKKLRLKQEYFFSSASITDMLRKFKCNHGTDFNKFPLYYTIQLNDTHPVIAIPELIRQLMDNENIGFSQAFEIAQRTFHYTNHTIMAEALEKWNASMVFSVLPRIYDIIILINERLNNDLLAKDIKDDAQDNLKIISLNTIHMARLAIYASSHTNGVAKIHTDILKKRELKDWYSLYPERFINITNGITQRRWLALCNPRLSSLITKLLGNKDWVVHLNELKKLSQYAENMDILRQFINIKQQNKADLGEYIKQHENIVIDPTHIFDTQIKRMHEYKRQLMNAFSILYIYFAIKDGILTDFTPTTFIFGAKSAPGYARAKGIIKYINEIANLVNNDSQTAHLLKVVYVQNYNVSYAERLVSAADVSEQISTAGTEASGTGNMKFMLNGTVTLGTYDGANIEIVDQAGKENSYIFGAKSEELDDILPYYDPNKIYKSDSKIRRVIDTLIDGTFDDGDTGIFKELYDSLLKGASWHRPDNYYILGDLNSYISAKLEVNRDYKDQILFAKKCWYNMCNAGKFSSDRTVLEYSQNIWDIKPVDL